MKQEQKNTPKAPNGVAGLEFAQTCWVVPDIHAAVKFLSGTLGVTFPEVQHGTAQEFNMSYYGEVEEAEWLTTQTYNGIYIELVQPLSGKSMFADFLKTHPQGGIQHNAFRLPVSGFERVTDNLRNQFTVVGEVDHHIARMAFFDTYGTLGVVTEIMGITPEGWKILEQIEQS